MIFLGDSLGPAGLLIESWAATPAHCGPFPRFEFALSGTRIRVGIETERGLVTTPDVDAALLLLAPSHVLPKEFGDHLDRFRDEAWSFLQATRG